MISKREVALDTLAGYLPEGTYPKVHYYLIRYKVDLTITRKRNSVLGDYRFPDKKSGHRITVNGDLNPYSFLLTLLHELAHLVAFTFYGNRIQPHGKEWKKTFSNILSHFTGQGYFPPDVEAAIKKYMINPAARSCADEDLIRTLRSYDPPKAGVCFVEDLEDGERFLANDGRIYQKGKKIRKRYECRDVKNRKTYLFSPVYEVVREKEGYLNPVLLEKGFFVQKAKQR